MEPQKRRIRIYDGRLVDPFDLKPKDVVPKSYMHSIAIINRFTGATIYPYSVGQHSLVLSYHVPGHLQQAAFIHDWSETLFNDVASPVKHQFQNYCDAEKAAEKVIFEAMGVPWEHLNEIAPYDKRIYKNERDLLFSHIEGATVGMGDRRIALDIDTKHFRERPWRAVENELYTRFDHLFPEWSI